jgi:hypothetical protein
VRLLARKKIIFVIVEGPSDDEALGVIFNRLYDKQSVHIEITHGDITSDKNFSPHNIVSKVGDIVKLYAKFNHYTKNDFLKIIHIMDVDGAYIPDEYVIENALITDKPIYSLINIQAQNPSNICKRNHHKCTNMDRLQAQKVIWKNISYHAYYMSCNLDHVLYNKLNCTDDEKANNALQFAKKYKDHLDDFLFFICDSDFSLCGDYSESWEFIRKGLNSLNRYSNLGICFVDIRKSKDITAT